MTKILTSVGRWVWPTFGGKGAQLPARFGGLGQPLIDAIPQLVWVTDGDGRSVYANRRWGEFTGLECDRTVEMDWLNAVHPDEVDENRQAWSEALSSRREYQTQCRLRCARDGSYRWHLCRVVPQYDDVSGRPDAWVATFTDFDAVKRALQARDDVLSAASHELRTPLTALKLRLEALAHPGNPNPKLRERVESAIKQAMRLEKLIDELLDLSHLVERRAPLRYEATELFELTSHVLERIRPEVAECGAKLELSGSSPVRGYWDRERIEQVITLLLLNATKRGRGTTIRVHIGSEDGLAKLTVEEHGLRLRSARLSQPFDGLERRSDAGDRSGLEVGLYLAREIIAAHGGAIRIVSGFGQGTAFTIELPKQGSMPP